MNSQDRKLPDFDGMELREFARSVVEVEWLLVALALVYVYFADFGRSGPELYIAVVAAFAVSILLLRYTPIAGRMPRAVLGIELGLMTLFVTLISWQTGGPASPLINLFLLPLITSALVFGRLMTLWLSVFLVACLTVLLVASGTGTGIGVSEVATLFTLLAPMLLVVILTTLLAENIRRSREQIRDLGDRDSLTEQYNMQAFSRRILDQHERSQRTGEPYTVVMIDVDSLRQINEEFGYEIGNRAIVLVSRAVERCIRRDDVLARFGGDEFILLLPGSDEPTAQKVVLRIRNSIFSTTFSVGKTMIRVSVSVGTATYPSDGEDHRELIGAADRAMYRDKVERRRIEASKLPSSYRPTDR